MARIVLPQRDFLLEQLSPVPVKLPIYTCSAGHYSDDPKKCPSCKSTKLIRCDFLEGLLQLCSFSCPHQACESVVPGHQLSDHVQSTCHYRPITCSYGLCERASVPFWNYIDHLQHGHAVQGNLSDSPKAEILLAPGANRCEVAYKTWKNNTFLIWSMSSPFETYIWVQLYGAEGEEKEFSAKIDLAGKKSHSTRIRFPVTSIRADFESAKGKTAYAHLSKPTLVNYMIGELLRVSVCIQSSRRRLVYQLDSPSDEFPPETEC